MPSRPSALALAAPLALALAACGNYSTDDVAFVEALPPRGLLQAQVPASAAAALSGAGPVTCGSLGAAAAWANARPQGLAFNAGVDVVLALVDAVRGVPPTRRDRDARTWGPFDDKNHPGKEIRVVMTRTWDGDRPTFAYAFQGRDKAAGGDWASVIEGAFVGGSARTGRGTLAIHFGTIRALGMSDHPLTDPTGDIAVAYDRTGDPRTLELDLSPDPTGGFGLEHFHYAYVGWQDGFGRFDYAFRNLQNDRLEVASRFAPGGEGQGSIAFFPAAGGSGSYQMCWDWQGCATAVNDPSGFSGACGPGVPCVVNWGPGGGCPVTR